MMVVYGFPDLVLSQPYMLNTFGFSLSAFSSRLYAFSFPPLFHNFRVTILLTLSYPIRIFWIWKLLPTIH